MVAMATAHVCFKCYMRMRREREAVDRHNPILRKEHITLLKLYTKMMDVLAGLKVDEPTKASVIHSLRPYFSLVEHIVNLDGGISVEDDLESAQVNALPPTPVEGERDELTRALLDIINPPVSTTDEDMQRWFARANHDWAREVLITAAAYGNSRAQKTLQLIGEQRAKPNRAPKKSGGDSPDNR
jgi:hypothetical protein